MFKEKPKNTITRPGYTGLGREPISPVKLSKKIRYTVWHNIYNGYKNEDQTFLLTLKYHGLIKPENFYSNIVDINDVGKVLDNSYKLPGLNYKIEEIEVDDNRKSSKGKYNKYLNYFCSGGDYDWTDHIFIGIKLEMQKNKHCLVFNEWHIIGLYKYDRYEKEIFSLPGESGMTRLSGKTDNIYKSEYHFFS